MMGLSAMGGIVPNPVRLGKRRRVDIFLRTSEPYGMRKAIWLVFCVLPGLAFAEEIQDFEQLDLEELLDVVFTAAKHEQDIGESRTSRLPAPPRFPTCCAWFRAWKWWW
jgi:hypothetical protein